MEDTDKIVEIAFRGTAGYRESLQRAALDRKIKVQSLIEQALEDYLSKEERACPRCGMKPTSSNGDTPALVLENTNPETRVGNAPTFSLNSLRVETTGLPVWAVRLLVDVARQLKEGVVIVQGKSSGSATIPSPLGRGADLIEQARRAQANALELIKDARRIIGHDPSIGDGRNVDDKPDQGKSPKKRKG